jgi:hypothetical protein
LQSSWETISFVVNMKVLSTVLASLASFAVCNGKHFPGRLWLHANMELQPQQSFSHEMERQKNTQQSLLLPQSAHSPTLLPEDTHQRQFLAQQQDRQSEKQEVYPLMRLRGCQFEETKQLAQ